MNGTAPAAANVDTKSTHVETFGNDTIGFIRVRKRATGKSFDLVRAVRVNGKPRHQFVLGLGSQGPRGKGDRYRFWWRAIVRMEHHGLSELQRRRLVAEMIRKGAQHPTIEQCERVLASISDPRFARYRHKQSDDLTTCAARAIIEAIRGTP